MTLNSFARGNVLLLVIVAHACSYAQLSKPAALDSDTITLSDVSIAATWSIKDGMLRWQSLRNFLTGESLTFTSSAFDLVPKEGPVLHSYDFKIVGTPALEVIPAALSSSKGADRLPGRRLRFLLRDSSNKIEVTFNATLREGTSYIREEITIHPSDQPVSLTQIMLV